MSHDRPEEKTLTQVMDELRAQEERRALGPVRSLIIGISGMEFVNPPDVKGWAQQLKRGLMYVAGSLRTESSPHSVVDTVFDMRGGKRNGTQSNHSPQRAAP